MEPSTIIGGKISGYPRKSTLQDFQYLRSKEFNVGNQKSSKTTLEAAAATTMAEESKFTAAKQELAMEQKQRKKEK